MNMSVEETSPSELVCHTNSIACAHARHTGQLHQEEVHSHGKYLGANIEARRKKAHFGRTPPQSDTLFIVAKPSLRDTVDKERNTRAARVHTFRFLYSRFKSKWIRFKTSAS